MKLEQGDRVVVVPDDDGSIPGPAVVVEVDEGDPEYTYKVRYESGEEEWPSTDSVKEDADASDDGTDASYFGQAKLMHFAMWGFLSNNDGMSKQQHPQWEKFENLRHHCSACELSEGISWLPWFDFNIAKRHPNYCPNTKSICPLAWKNGYDRSAGCFNEYAVWTRDKNSDMAHKVLTIPWHTLDDLSIWFKDNAVEPEVRFEAHQDGSSLTIYASVYIGEEKVQTEGVCRVSKNGLCRYYHTEFYNRYGIKTEGGMILAY